MSAAWQKHGSDRARAVLCQLFERGEQRLGVGLGPGRNRGADIVRPAPAFQQAFRKDRNGDLVLRKVPNRGNGAAIAGPCQQDRHRNLTDFGKPCSNAGSTAGTIGAPFRAALENRSLTGDVRSCCFTRQPSPKRTVRSLSP